MATLTRTWTWGSGSMRSKNRALQTYNVAANLSENIPKGATLTKLTFTIHFTSAQPLNGGRLYIGSTSDGSGTFSFNLGGTWNANPSNSQISNITAFNSNWAASGGSYATTAALKAATLKMNWKGASGTTDVRIDWSSITLEVQFTYTNVTAPTTVSVNASYATPGASKTLSWSGAAAGTNNPIDGYQVQYAEWNSAGTVTTSYTNVWASTTATSGTVTASSTRTNRRRWRVRTLGRYNSSDYVTSNFLNTPAAAGTPGTPTANPTYVASGGSSTISWSAGSNATGYNLAYSTDGTNWTDWGTTTSTSKSGTWGAAQYRVRVRAYNAASEYSGWATSGVIVTGYTAGKAPTSVSISATSTTTASASLTLSWSGASGGTNNGLSSYTPQYSDNNSSWTSLSATTSTSITVTGPGSGGTRYWRVIANCARATYTSGTVSCIHYTNGTGSVSISPSGWTTTTGNATITVNRSAGTNNAFSRYTIQRSTNNSSWSDLATGQTGATYAVAISDTYYYYRALIYFARNTVTTGSVSVGHYTAVTVPSTVTVSPTLAVAGGAATLSWSGQAGGTNNAISSYTIQYSDNGGSSWANYATNASSGASVVAPAAGTTRRYRIAVIAARGTYYSTAYASIAGNSAPTAPGTPTFSSPVDINTSLTISWTASTDANSNLSGYSLEVSTNNGTSWIVVSTSTTNSQTYTPTAIGSYIFRVRAYDSLSAYSNYSSNSAALTVRYAQPMITVNYPANEVITYDSQPWYSVTTDLKTSPNYTIYLKIDDANATSMVTGTADQTSQFIRSSTLSAGQHTLSFYVTNSQGRSSDTVTRVITYTAPAYARTIASGDLISSSTISHIAEINQMLSYVNNQRTIYGLTLVAFSETVGNFASWDSNITQLINGMLAVQRKIQGGTVNDVSGVPEWPTASYINQIRNLIASW